MVASRHRLNVDFGELTAPWIRSCADRGESAHAALRRIVAQELGTVSQVPVHDIPMDVEIEPIATATKLENDGVRRVRCEVRLTTGESEMIDRRAASGGDKRQRWIIACLRHQLFREVQLTSNEQVALRRSNDQLLAIGRNLNQLVKALNTGAPVAITAQTPGLRNLRGAIREHIESVERLVLASESRWSYLRKKKAEQAAHE